MREGEEWGKGGGLMKVAITKEFIYKALLSASDTSKVRALRLEYIHTAYDYCSFPMYSTHIIVYTSVLHSGLRINNA